MNTLKTFLFLLGLMALFLFVGRLLGGQQGMVVAFFMACLMNLVSYWFSDKIVLAIYRAKPMEEEEAPELFRMVKKLAQSAGIPMPKVFRMPSPVPNAFATGRSPRHAAVAVTEGLLKRLSASEVEGVLAHELSHVLHRDTLISAIAATVAGAVMMLADMARWGMMFGGLGGRDRENRGGLELLVAAILAPLAATLIQLAISRSREYEADRGAAHLTGNPLALANALRKIADDNSHSRVPLSQNPASAHLFIMNPLRGQGLFALFSTHPPTEERIRRLESMVGQISPAGTPKVIY